MIILGDMKLYDVRDLAELLQVREKTARNLLRNGTLKGKKLAKKCYITKREVEAYFGDTTDEV